MSPATLWREQAETLRKSASGMHDPATRETLLVLAGNCESLAMENERDGARRALNRVLGGAPAKPRPE